MPIMYYGSKISDNMVRTPEGYLICKNVPIGRIGWMDYLGEELGLEDRRGEVVKVCRTPEELFSKATIASFEGKPATNNHPSKNLTLDTVGMYERGHMENVRQDGDYLLADLYIKEAGLIAEIENGKREVSCGYDCLWVPIDGGRFEQKEIVGNHVAVVQNGRAGSRVAIKDEKPENISKEGSYKGMKVTDKVLAAIGFKQFAADAKPEELAEAMEALRVVGMDNGMPTGSAETILEAVKKINEDVKALDAKFTALDTRVAALDEASKEDEKEEGADSEFEKLEKEADDAAPEGEEVQDEDDDEVQDAEVIEAEDEASVEEKKEAGDSMAPFIKMMKPIIMAIPDEKARNAAAKQFAKSVRDARATSGKNGYGNVVDIVAKNKKNAMDNSAARTVSKEQNIQASVNNWNKRNAHFEGGK